MMTNEGKLNLVKSVLGITDYSEDERIAAFLIIAGREILAWRYSYAAVIPDSVPEEFEMTQVYAVVAGYSQSGAENQIRHNENGISREFKHSDMVQYIHATVIPLCKVVG